MLNLQPDSILPKSFFEGRNPPPVHRESMDALQWWEEQLRRCYYGYSDGGFTLTGVNYYHLNMIRINMWDERNNCPIIWYPYYSCEDQEIFNVIQECRQHPKRPGVMLITGRGFGKSFDASTVVSHQYALFPASETIISASVKLFADLLWDKIGIGINSLPDEIKPTALVERQDYLESGYKVKENGVERTYGDRSKIRKVIYDDNEGRTRGTRPDLHVFDEVGSWTGAAKLIDCYKATSASWYRGKYSTCFALLCGTGGQMRSGGSEDARKMFYDPESYNLRAFEFEGTKRAMFYPAFRKFGGFYEKTGVSDEAGAKAFLEERRRSKLGDSSVFMQEVQEFPFTAEEAFYLSDGGIFDIEKINHRLAQLQRNPGLREHIPESRLVLALQPS